MSKTIFFITNSLSGGGAERVMSNLANYLTQRGYCIKFLLLNGNEQVYPLDNSIEIIIRKNDKKKDIKGQIKFIRKYMKNNKNALFVSFFTHQNLYTILASFALKVKVLVSERNHPLASCNGKISSRIRNYLYSCRYCKKIIFQTKGAADYFSDKIKNKSDVIPNPLKDGLPDRYNGNRKNIVVSFGRFETQKNYELLVNAFADFSKKHSDYTLELYGKGSHEERLKALSTQLGISDKVLFKGFCPDVHSKIIDAKMFVIPSNFEGLSNSMLEALAIGVPVISTDHPPGGAKAYITSYENGILTPVKDKKAMTKAMCFMAENPEKANEMGEKASILKETLSSENICEKWRNIFDELLEVKK